MGRNVIGRTSNNKTFLHKLCQGPAPWLAPMVIVLVALFIVPTVQVIVYSFTNASLLRPTYSYTLRSYAQVLTNPETYVILKNTFIFVFFSVVFQTLLGLVIALAVDKGEQINFHGSVFIRVICLLSWAIPGVIVGVVWNFLYTETGTGILIYIFDVLGLPDVHFLTDLDTALTSTIIANIWRGTAQSMILTYAGLKTIPRDIIEASSIDGANSLQRLWKIILPTIFSVISTNIILNTINTFNTFDMIISLTNGGPGRATEVLAMTSYNQIFSGQMNLGRGSVYATILLFINSCMAAVYFYVLHRRNKG